MKEVSFVRRFIMQDFLLENDVSRELYHEYAKDQPIHDYHGHLTVDDIAINKTFRYREGQQLRHRRGFFVSDHLGRTKDASRVTL